MSNTKDLQSFPPPFQTGLFSDLKSIISSSTWVQWFTGIREDVKSIATYASVMPTSGTFSAGDVVWNNAPSVLGSAGSRYIILGWKRITNGSGNVLNTDWVQMRSLTGT